MTSRPSVSSDATLGASWVVHLAPPSVEVAKRSPKAYPSDALANRTLDTSLSDEPSRSTRRQLFPPSLVANKLRQPGCAPHAGVMAKAHPWTSVVQLRSLISIPDGSDIGTDVDEVPGTTV